MLAMFEKQVTPDLAAFVWVWNVAFAGFFTFVRAIVKQEFRAPWMLAATSFISFCTALFTGQMVELWGGPEWMVRISVAGSALLSYDLLRALIHFGGKFDGNVIWALVKSYTGTKGIQLPDQIPTKPDKVD